jgi:chorismate lyase/3-hydroxybenzoate synthase
VWSSNTKVYFGEEDRIRWSFNESTLVASLYLEDFDNDDLSSKTQLAYEILLKFIKKSEFPHIVRIWNYIREINLGIGDQERYKQFCHGRAQAFDRFRYSPDQYPAACAIGQHAEQSVIYLIASKMPPKHYENPVQVSAYHYPRQYGPRSPSFARATTLNNHQLFLSGTAAVVGHQTVRHDDLEGQLEVTIDNINKMIAYIKNDNQSSGYTPAILRVYIRYSGHYSQIKATLDEYFCNVKDVSFMYVQGDICRENLLVEVDGEYFKK